MFLINYDSYKPVGEEEDEREMEIEENGDGKENVSRKKNGEREKKVGGSYLQVVE